VRPRLSALALAAAWLAPSLLAAGARAAEPAEAGPPKDRYFYFGYDYGSQALWSPFYLFLNRGFDALQLRKDKRNPVTQPYALDAGNVLRNLGTPIQSVSKRGFGRFAREEIFPLTYTQGDARWVPNYVLHLLGGGVDYVALREWYEDRGAPAPAVWGALSLYAAAFMNETIENYGIRGTNTDAIADLYVFDLAGVLLFSIDAVPELFSRYFLVSDWSLQPVYTLPRGQLHNQGNYFALKWPVPFEERLRLFAYGGYSNLFGLSWRFASGHSLTGAAGVKVDELVARQIDVSDNVIGFAPSGALFLDRRESLLASIQVADVSDYFVHVNVYPNAFFRSRPGVGFFGVVGQDGRFAVGLSFTGGLYGLGAGTL
jgi:hypothetical protein